MKPQRFASYTLLRHLATGGMGELYLARRDGVAGFSKQVVVKRLRDDLALDEEFVEMFLDEGRLAAMLDHANIVHVHELGKADDSYFMAMEYVHGIDLGSLLRAVDGPLDLTAALYIMRNVCEGLAFAHDATGMDGQPMHLVHRDINPQNILISEAGAVKITDFGIAKVAQRQRQTQAGILKGKFGYLSPEQARGQRVDRRCDVYALGLLLFEMTTGQSAVPLGSDAQMLEVAAHGMLRQPEELEPTYPRALGDIFRRCTSYRPEDRFQNVPDLLDALVEFQMDARIHATPKALVELVSRHFGETFDAQRRALTPATSPPPTRSTPSPSQPPDLVGNLWGMEGDDDDDTIVQRISEERDTQEVTTTLSDEATTSRGDPDEVSPTTFPAPGRDRVSISEVERSSDNVGLRPAATVALGPEAGAHDDVHDVPPFTAQATEVLDGSPLPPNGRDEETLRHHLTPRSEAKHGARVTIGGNPGDENEDDPNGLMYQKTALFSPEDSPEDTESDAWIDDPYRTGPPPPATSDAFATMALPPRESVPEDRPDATAPPQRPQGTPPTSDKAPLSRWWIFVLASLLILVAASAAGYYTRLVRDKRTSHDKITPVTKPTHPHVAPRTTPLKTTPSTSPRQ